MTFLSLAATAALGLAGILASGPGLGQAYPSRPVRIIVGFPPGGGADAVPRLLAPRLGERLGQAVVVENRPGASGNIGAELVARAAPDGYTLLNVPITHAINASLFRNLAYDPVADFSPITVTTASLNVLVVHPALPVRDVAGLIQLARKRPGEITFGSGGAGTTHHLAGELFRSLGKVDLLHVPFKGGGPAIASLVGGHVQVMFASTPEVTGHLKSGRLRALAVTSAQRSSLLPALPTVAESGIPEFEVSGWLALLAPAAVRREVVLRLNEEAVAVLQEPAVRERISALGFAVVGNDPEQAATHLRREISRWAALVKSSGARAD
ncbi:MAG: tripartite tricarboxylate transporter substrate binding protein [bacterium]|jgi:tripartite-type tricarboxylate transporter receptor subunit TctC|nr:tripartite tricarboxylate transporter substrate binding protein [Betaproteobacteria bacterium]